MAWGCAGWFPPPAPFDRLRLRPEAQPEGAGLSSFAGEPALSLSKRGDQSHARGRSNAVYATLARMFCPPLNARGVGAVAVRADESLYHHPLRERSRGTPSPPARASVPSSPAREESGNAFAACEGEWAIIPCARGVGPALPDRNTQRLFSGGVRGSYVASRDVAGWL